MEKKYARETLLEKYHGVPLDQLVDAMHHDIRNRLSLISGYVQFMREDLSGPYLTEAQKRKFIEDILTCIKAIDNIAEAGLATEKRKRTEQSTE